MPPRDQDAPPPGDSGLLDVFGSDIEEEGGERSRSQKPPAQDVTESRPSHTSSAPVKVHVPVEDEILPQEPQPEVDDDAEDEPARIPRSKEPSASVAAASGRTSVMDSLDADDYEDEDYSSRKRKQERSLSSKSKKARIDSDDDEPRRRKDDDEFIDDRDADRNLDDEDDVIRTEGGMDVSKEIEDDNPEEEEPKKKKLTAFEEALQQTKAMRRSRKKEVDQSKVDSECIAFLDRMVQARDEDIKCYKRGKPALNKLRMLREVETMTTKLTHRETLIEHMMLPVFKAWLDPMPDGTLPNVAIRTSLLNILSSIRMDDNWVQRLKDSQGLGRVIHFLAKNDDHVPNRRAAEKLMNKWARPVYQSNSDYHDLLSEYDRPDQGYKARPDSIAAERRRARESAKHFKTSSEKLDAMRGKNEPQREQVLARVPKPSAFLYTALAEGTAKVDEKVQREHRAQANTSKKVNRTMSKMRNLNRSRSARAAKPSLNGRSINM